jgi:dihydrofolate reductase
MYVLLDMAISPNGMIAREDGDEDWLPSEGWNEFVELAKSMNNIVMGRETYEQVTARYKDYNFENVDCKYKIIVTKDKAFSAPDGYSVAHSPEDAVRFIESKGLNKLFLIGGGKLNSAFIRRKLVNRIQLTISPYIIGKGRSFIAPEDFDVPLRLISHTALSEGRIQLVYEVESS